MTTEIQEPLTSPAPKDASQKEKRSPEERSRAARPKGGRRRPKPQHHGLLLIDKTAGCTSHDVVMSARRVLRQKKIGHCGTLDPDATGLLLLTVGRATRLTRFLIRAPKVYEGVIRLGLTTDTYDLAGEVTEEKPVEHLSAAEVRAAMEPFLGRYLQTPPPYCAKKVGGVKYYELARRGEKTPDTKKEVTVYDFHALGEVEPARDPDVSFLLSCSSGTYARSLAHEVGRALGCGGALAKLRRTQIGAFKIDQALEIEALAERLGDTGSPASEGGSGLETAGGAWVPFDEIQLPFDEIVADPQQERRITNGQTMLVRDLESGEGDWLKIVNQSGRFIAVGAVVECIGTGRVGVVQPKVVFSD